jgi:hypothetical protein
MAGSADAGAAVEDGTPGAEGDRRCDQRQERREHQQDRGGDEDVERPQQRVDGARIALGRGRDEFFEAGLGFERLAQEGVTG